MFHYFKRLVHVSLPSTVAKNYYRCDKNFHKQPLSTLIKQIYSIQLVKLQTMICKNRTPHAPRISDIVDAFPVSLCPFRTERFSEQLPLMIRCPLSAVRCPLPTMYYVVCYMHYVLRHTYCVLRTICYALFYLL